MISIALFISVFFIVIPTMINTQIHKALRDNRTYYTLFILSFLLVFGVTLSLNANLGVTDKINSFASLGPITFLILYRQFDNFIVKKLKRHIYFHSRFTKLFPDKESKGVTPIEYLFQMLLFIIPFLWLVGGYLVFK